MVIQIYALFFVPKKKIKTAHKKQATKQKQKKQIHIKGGVMLRNPSGDNIPPPGQNFVFMGIGYQTGCNGADTDCIEVLYCFVTFFVFKTNNQKQKKRQKTQKDKIYHRW